ncbi:MAG TPA: cytochrome c nitrite reductase small subunit [Candidatus Binatia bacterium]|nr:cytochrome c nitrite reductase small subunit [Candidatus Binatia bacterium]
MATSARNLWLILMATAVGFAVGIGGFTFVYARGASYLTDDPRACANCHVMRAQFEGWIRSSHRSAAVCNDCHTPKNILAKYLNKSANGARHSWAFTTGWFHEPIAIKAGNRAVTESRCRDCHREITEAISGVPAHGGEALGCIRCHGSVGHP